MKKALSSLVLLLLWTSYTLIAQECPDFVEETLATVAENCSTIGRNEVCYGNTEITVETNADVIFENPGDVMNIGDIESLSMSGTEAGEWAVALLNLQANLPETLPGQNVTVMLFGNVELSPADDSLQAFYFTGGIGQPNCAEAPDGIILQSPLGETVALTINGAEIEFGSTILLQQNEAELNLSTLAGIASIEADGIRQTVIQGTQSSVALDSNYSASEAPVMASPLNAEELSPFVKVVNESNLVLPTYEDAAGNPVIEALVNSGRLAALDAENPVSSLPVEDIPAVLDGLGEIRASLDPNAILVNVGEFNINTATEGKLTLEYGPITVISGGETQIIEGGEETWTSTDPETGMTVEFGPIEVISGTESQPPLTLEFGEIKVISGQAPSDSEWETIYTDPESGMSLQIGEIEIIRGGESLESDAGEWETIYTDPESGMSLELGPITVISEAQPKKLTLEFGPIRVISGLPTEEIQILSGYWYLVEQTHDVYGDCIDDSTVCEGCGGGVVDQGDGTPICPLAEGGGIIFQDGMLERLDMNLYGSEYTGERPNYSGEGTVTETLSWHYQVMSPTRIVMTFTLQEEGGCTIVSTFVYELASEDTNACEDVDLSGDYSSEEEEEFETFDIASGDYSSSDFFVTGCDADFGSEFENISLSVQGDSLDLTAGTSVYNLPAMGSLYMFYEGNLTITVMSLDEGQVSMAYADGSCMVAGTYEAE